MSTAVYYSNHNTVEDIHSKHTLPSLSQIMPMGQQQQQTQYSHDATLAAAQAVAASPHQTGSTGQLSPTLVNSNLVPMSNLPMFDQKMVYQTTQQHHHQSSPDVFSQSSQPSTAHTTPASSFSAGLSGYHAGIIGNPGHQVSGASSGSVSSASSEKCVCKSNANRIPRPRNAFILFRQKYHQSVLDEGSVIRTNPEVSRELGRRWRALSGDEKDYWNNLAEEEKKNHAKKYPGYRYTPRRNGKNKNCIPCRQKAMRQQQVQVHNQQMIQLQQEQYQQYLQLQQQAQPQAQPQAQQQMAQPQANAVPQQFNNGNFVSANPHNQQFIIASNYQQGAGQVPQPPPGAPTFQFSFNNEFTGQTNNANNNQDKLSPLFSVPYHSQMQQMQQPAGSGASHSHNNTPPNHQAHTSEFMMNGGSNGNPQFVIAYDQQANSGAVPHQQRFNSLPTPVNGANGYTFDGFSQQ
ncbi:uncharacterized protein CANTADRAFT_19731 [Suhomyces tanzawaensis NRRL Y-17324]|uniref:HMG box domain-containing protein n=1 Tax=Suhomyces tanzawaensis NRRL Y-17324 TaxID=984487 RepID=A0A1E4SRX9_9ASCO|nr:uncharacterized protein CANTADRAFT_19731 [Suhomyces tanzawaensis NRRL Y-17324]ODV82152.1 hypothetical protein CANTADRAFT_19731 [Suhomyces tanzawaensis NRRL Y-17324]